tara:strand:- start:12690 stop:15821 length:3132 start_codon:yes stop_codon:yes gene_type:complete
MSAKNFKFVSPGVFINEIDNSQLPKVAPPVGPVVIGRFRRGPAFLPTRVESLSELIEIFGAPIRGDEASDVWRGGQPTAPTYGAYAAAAWLKNGEPVTVVRLLGDQHSEIANSTQSDAAAGWNMGTTPSNTGNPGGAYGLFLMNSSSAAIGATGSVNGVLAASWYFGQGGIILSGTIGGAGTTIVSGSGVLIESESGATTPGYTFTAELFDSGQNTQTEGGGTGTPNSVVRFNFDKNSKYYVRKVFNTNPTKTNSALVSDNGNTENYFLGETYEKAVQDTISGAKCYGVILPLGNSNRSGNTFKKAAIPSQTGWFIAQDLRTTAGSAVPGNNTLSPAYNPDNPAICARLFKLHTLSAGEAEQRTFKVSVENVKYSKRADIDPYGSFSLVIRSILDNDTAPRIVERYDNCNLNPNSSNYVARKVGDSYFSWDNTKKRLTEYGTYPNNSKIVRIEMSSEVDLGQADAELLPFGVQGPVKRQSFRIQFQGSGSSANGAGVTAIPGTAQLVGPAFATASFLSHTSSFGDEDVDIQYLNVFRSPGDSFKWVDQPAKTSAMAGARPNNSIMWSGTWLGSGSISNAVSGAEGHANWLATIKFPDVFQRANAGDGNLSDPTLAYFGYSTNSGSVNTSFDASNLDLLRPLPSDYDQFSTDNYTKRMFVFSLDDLSASAGGAYSYASGSREAGNSITARSGSYKDILDAGYDRFTAPLFGGFDGLDITEAEPFNNTRALRTDAGEKTYAMYYSVKKAIDMLADPEFIEMNLATVPGVTNENLTQHLINVCEDRADALAIIDPKGGYDPKAERAGTEESRISTNHVDEVVTNMERRAMNSSYGCAYYPWVRISDDISGGTLWAPPSVAALGAMAYSDKRKAVWFAPAGFHRGGLSRGAAGFPVLNVRSKLTSADRDDLYEANINPIASFPQEGIVIFGQKTLQVTPSALDRINVRRLMIFVKKQVSRIAANLLFEQNVQETWNRFTSQVEPFLSNIQSQFGLSEFRVVLDETTTTPELIDRNVMYAKIFLKPARAIEFIAIDFNITNTGASFDD